MPRGDDLLLSKSALVADLFCGAGGSSTGARRALVGLGYRMNLVAVNHWPIAIETHSRNHPEAHHYCQDVNTAKPGELVPEGKLYLLMASPTCTYHSRARGGKPINDQKRMDPWAIIHWCTELRVQRLIVENVPEYIEWGPLDGRTGRPLKSRKGQFFLLWVQALKGIFRYVEWRILNCADHGDATTRVRFFLMASNVRKFRWPRPSHSRDGGTDMFETTERWRAAREIIDWTIEGKSIFTRKRPLSPKTLARIYAGAVKFKWPEPFLVILRQHMGARSLDRPLPAARSIDAPVPTMTTAKGGEYALVMPVTHGDDAGRVRSTDEPLPTVTGAHRGELACIVAAFGEREGQTPRVHSVEDPAPTIAAQGRIQLGEGVLDGLVYDIRFRMLEPKELARAMGFSDDEVEYEFCGTKTDITRQIGNAVPVNTAAALVRAIMEG